MKEKEGLLYKEGQELDVIVVDGREVVDGLEKKSPSALTIEKPPSDRYAVLKVLLWLYLNEPQCHTLEMYTSAIIGVVVTHDLDL